MKYLIHLLFIFLVFGCTRTEKRGTEISAKSYRTDAPYLVILSMDGFRWDYPQIYHTPNLDSVAATGVRAKSLIPCFPSKTFPNHYSIATGLYPENHGIVQNNFYDPVLGDYRLNDRKAVQNPGFYLGEPLWVTAEKQHLRTACLYWPGSEAPVRGIYPDTWKEYDPSVSFEARIDTVVTWLKRPAEERPHLIMWYFSEPDHTGHHEGPESEQTQKMVEHLDSLVGVFCRKINDLSMADSINLVFTSDHGMQSISPERAIALEQYIKGSWVERVSGGNPVMLFDPKENCTDSILTALKKVEHLQVYTKATIPESLHYSRSNRIFDVICVADSAWSIYWKATGFSSGGTHGYDPANMNMHTIFYASGPAFVKHYVSPAFQNIQMYPLFAHILQLAPVETDGDPKVTAPMLMENSKKDQRSFQMQLPDVSSN